MQLPAPEVRAIARGAKTSLRIPVDTRLTAQPLRPARRHQGSPFNPAPGDILAVRSDTSTTHCKIRALARGPLGFLDDQQAGSEGYETAEQFEIAWVEHYHRAWLDNQIRDLVENGEPVELAQETRPLWARVRYEHYWAPREVWSLTIEPFDDIPYLLPGLPEEPEGIPADRIHMRWQIKSDRRLNQAKTEEARRREARALARQVRLLALNGDPVAQDIARLVNQAQREAA